MTEERKFDLINWENKKYVTRMGRPARIICVDVKNEVFPIIALVKDSKENENVHSYYQDGRRQEITSHMDLFNAIEPQQVLCTKCKQHFVAEEQSSSHKSNAFVAPEPKREKEVWICLYTDNTLTYHYSLKTADGQHPAILKDRIARKKVVIREGEWDE